MQRTAPWGKIREVSLALKAIQAQENRESARRKAEEAARKLRDLWLGRAARIVAEDCEETLTYYGFPSAHWRNLRINNPLECLNREICCRTRAVGSFPDGHAALMLVSKRLRYMASQQWGNPTLPEICAPRSSPVTGLATRHQKPVAHKVRAGEDRANL